jgi:hypothetical protein
MAKHLARLAKTIVDERRIRNFQPTQPKMWVRTSTLVLGIGLQKII